jgi:hypothetical protein
MHSHAARDGSMKNVALLQLQSGRMAEAQALRAAPLSRHKSVQKQ